MAAIRESKRLVSLASLDDGEVYFVPGFTALVHGDRVLVTAVLERTAVIQKDGVRSLIRKEFCLVEQGSVEIRRVASAVAAKQARLRGANATKKASQRPRLEVVTEDEDPDADFELADAI
jgi:hypothetical protein